MDATQEWLRYIESKMIKQMYDIKGYTTDKDIESSEEVDKTDN